MEPQTWLSCHDRFISTENITILPISSDDLLNALLEIAEQQMWSYSSCAKNMNNILNNHYRRLMNELIVNDRSPEVASCNVMF